MIPRRIAEHVKAHNWFAVAIDFVIVVLGVFIGIQVANWNAGRIERDQAWAYIERIREDLRRNQEAAGGRMAYYRQVKAHALAALAGFDQPKEALGEQFLIDAFQASQILSRVFDRATYDEILSVGALNTIPDVAIRRRLSNFYQNVEALEEINAYIPPYRESLRRLMPYAVQAAIFSRCDDVTVVDAQGLPTSALPEGCEIGLAPQDAAAAVEAIRDPELKRDLVRRLSDIETKLANFQRIIDRAEALDRALAEAEF